MKRNIIAAIILIIIFNAEVVLAANDNNKMSKLQTFAFTQTLALGFGILPVFDPKMIGTVEVCVPFYLELASGPSEIFSRETLPIYIGFLSLGAYNLLIDEDETSDGEIFLVNYLGCNLMFLSSLLLHKNDAEKNTQAAFTPQLFVKSESVGFQFTYVF